MKKSILFLSIPLLAAIMVFSSFVIRQEHERVKGNGDIKQEKRPASAFKDIGTSGEFKVYIQQGNTHSIEIEAESNLLPYIVTEIDGKELEIKVKKGYSIKPTKPVNVYVTMEQINELAASGSGGFYSKGKLKADELEISVSGAADTDLDLDAKNVKVAVSGAGNVKLKGSSTAAHYSISGKADIAAFDLQSDDVHIGISGSANASVNAAKKLEVGVSGMGNVKYKGNPAISQSVSGMGRISKEG
jgi:hypothetical protein